MSRKNLLVAMLSALPLSAVPALSHAAQDDNPSGPYVGVGWGNFNLNVRNLDDAGTATGDILHSRNSAWKAFVGYRFIPYVALEAAYVDLGHSNDRFNGSGSNGNYRFSISGFSPAVVGTLPLGPVELFAKVGEYYYNSKLRVDLDNPGPDIDSSHTRNDLLYGGGVGVTFLDHIHVRAEYETIDIKNAKNSDAFWLSAAYRF